MTNTDVHQMIDALTAFMAGKTIEIRRKIANEQWYEGDPNWNFSEFEYREKKERKFRRGWHRTNLRHNDDEVFAFVACSLSGRHLLGFLRYKDEKDVAVSWTSSGTHIAGGTGADLTEPLVMSKYCDKQPYSDRDLGDE